jgi:hypothetical protein
VIRVFRGLQDYPELANPVNGKRKSPAVSGWAFAI